jgi:glycosyltransferase involved in cell wall biosynthesis
MRILLVSNYYPEHVGGIETVAANLALGYRTQGHQVRWVAGDVARRPHKGGEDDIPVGVWNDVEKLGFPYPLPSPGGAAGMSSHVAWSEVIHLHDCLYALNVVTFVASRRQHRPVLLTQHVAKVPYRSALVRGLQSAAYASIGRAVLTRAEQVVFVSERVMRWFEPRVRFKRPPVLIENGIDAELYHPLPNTERAALRSRLGANGSRPLLLFVGRFVEKKGVQLLLPLIQATPSYDWLLIGRAGDVDPSTWRLPNMKLLDPVKPAELRGYYAAADLLVLPSAGEGFPVVAQEAMACGTPALLSEPTAAGLPDLRDAVFTAPLSASELETGVRRAVQAVGADPGFRDRTASVARERWRAETMVSRYETQLRRLLN